MSILDCTCEPQTVPWDVENTGLVPQDVENTGLVPCDVENTGLVPWDVENTGLVPFYFGLPLVQLLETLTPFFILLFKGNQFLYLNFTQQTDVNP